MKKAINAVVFVAGGILLTACTPEMLTTSAACRAYEDMYINSPDRGGLSKKAAAYQVDYYRDLEKRTDGMLGEAFGEQREWAERVLRSDMSDGDTAPLHALSQKANKVIWDICGAPF
jgi:hypothetical protein